MDAKSSTFLMIIFTILFGVSEEKLDTKKLTSPNFPGKYPWSYFPYEMQHYSDSGANRIRILIKSVNLNPKDALIIYDGLHGCRYALKRFGGTSVPQHFPMMLFSISERICIYFNNYYGGYPGYEMDIFEFPRCNGDLTDEYGDIVSPHYNYLPYDPSSDCEWRIHADKGQGVQFNVEEFSVGCTAGDEVVISGGNTSVSLCERKSLTVSDSILIPHSLAKIKFTSLTQSKGFWIKYQTVGCKEVFFPAHLGSPLNPSSYYHVGYTLVYRCPPGWWYADNVREVSITCIRSGKWRSNFNIDTCIPITCGDPGTPSNGRLRTTNEDFTYNSTVYYDCEPGFYLIGASNLTCDQNGNWNGLPPTCKGIPTKCSLPADPEFGFRSTDDNSFGATVQFGCEKGYTLSGNLNITCLTNGTWSGPSPSCTIVECPAPVAPKNGSIINPGSSAIFQYGGYVEFVCNTGFRMVTEGDGVADCLFDGTWDEATPHCQAIDCGEPPLPVNGRGRWPDTGYGTVARYECLPGYTLDGSNVSVCLDAGWSSSVPMCQPLWCGQLLTNDSLTNAYVTSVSVSRSDGLFHYGQTVLVTCDDGYSMRRQETVTSMTVECDVTGEWSYNVSDGCPYEIHCPALEGNALLPASAELLEGGNLTEIESTAVIHCELTGQVVHIHCGLDGAWNSDLTKICADEDSGGFNAEAATNRGHELDLWLIFVIIGTSLLIIIIIGLIIIRQKRKQRDNTKADTEDHEYDNPIYGVTAANPQDQLTINQNGDVAFKNGDDWRSNPTYHDAVKTLERPDSCFADDAIYGNVDDYRR